MICACCDHIYEKLITYRFYADQQRILDKFADLGITSAVNIGQEVIHICQASNISLQTTVIS